MKLPRDLSGADLSKLLERFGYAVSRSRGSHIRVTTQQGGEHHVTIPAHDPLKVGTLSSILNDVAEHLDVTKHDLATALFGS